MKRKQKKKKSRDTVTAAAGHPNNINNDLNKGKKVINYHTAKIENGKFQRKIESIMVNLH